MLPSPRLIILVMAAAPLFLAGTLYDGAAGVGVVYVILLSLYSALDALVLPRRKDVAVAWDIPGRISVGYPTAFGLTVHNATRRRLLVQVAPDYPADIDIMPEQYRATLRPGRTVMRVDRSGERFALAFGGQHQASDHPLQFGKLSHGAGDEVVLGQQRRAGAGLALLVPQPQAFGQS